MIVTVIRCDKCKKLVDAPLPPQSRHGFTSGYYDGWFGEPGQICDVCMWADPRYVELHGPTPVTHNSSVAEILKAHQPTTNQEKRVHRCACGLEFHFVDAKAWHRHAAAMLLRVE